MVVRRFIYMTLLAGSGLGSESERYIYISASFSTLELGFAVSPAMLNFRFLHCLLVASSTLAAPAVSSGSVLESVGISSEPTTATASAISSLSSFISASKGGSGVSSALSEEQTVAPASDDPNEQIFPPGFDGTPEAIRGQLGASIISPDDTLLDQQNPDFLAPPSTDHGSTFVLEKLL